MVFQYNVTVQRERLGADRFVELIKANPHLIPNISHLGFGASSDGESSLVIGTSEELTGFAFFKLGADYGVHLVVDGPYSFQ